MQDWTTIHKQISASIARNFSVKDCTNLSGGCINSAWRISDDYSSFFIKLNSADQLAMFTAEFAGLQELRQSNSVKVPEPICYGVADNNSYLVTEYLALDHHYSAAQLGEQLADMHHTQCDHFGWHCDNTIGSTPQLNTQSDCWHVFWQQSRIAYQLSLAQQNGFNGKLQQLGEQLCDVVEIFFQSYKPVPSLLHGDLWSGNVAGINNTPVIFDPAVYYGDRETDIAMTELFGGFSQDFYRTYNATWPLDAGYATRKNLYNLYHLLNHLNLFGSGYYRRCVDTIRSLLAEVR